MSASVPLDAVIITPELDVRDARAPNPLAESRALAALLRSLKTPSPDVLQELAETAMSLTHAESAGVSIVDRQQERDIFRWRAAAGAWSMFLCDAIPREGSPCGTALERKTPLLMSHPERHYDYPPVGAPPLVETLLVPFEVDAETVGTVWAMLHDEERRFDREDLRVLRCLSDFASVAYRIIQQQQQIGEALNRELAGSRLLRSISALTSEGDIGSLYEHIVDAAVSIMRAQFATLQTIDQDGHLQLLAWRGFDSQLAELWQSVPLDSKSARGAALRARERFVVVDIERSQQLVGARDLAEFRRCGVRSLQATPLTTRGGTLIGAVSTYWREPNAPSDSDLRIFDVLARQTADLIERTSHEAALREGDRRKDEFLAVLGHELRNPLAPLNTGIELLQRAGHRQELVSNVHAMMKRQLVHLTRLVDDLLDLSRITRGQIDLQRAPLDLHVVTEAAVELTRPLIDRRGHTLRVQHDDPSLYVDGDLERLTQVVANLITNAAKYMDPGGAITLRTSVEGSQAVLRVGDRGFGIPPERLYEVFEMFSQVPEHRARRDSGGLGVGLALSRRLIQLHGGSLTASSDGLGQGSEFAIRLPLGAVELASRRDVQRPLAAVRSQRRVLIVDDNVDAAYTLRTALELSGHTVAVSHDGPQALQTFRSLAPDVLLLDIGLPDLDGYQLATHFRSRPGGTDLLLIAITGWGQDSDRARSSAAGFDLHLTKPVSLEVLEAALTRGRLAS